MADISIVVPLYNKAKYIKDTMKSLLNQSYQDYEVVVVDDGSTDGSADVIEREFNSKKIRIISKENGGPSSARNIGIKEAHSEWIVLIDADDYLLPNALELFVNKRSLNPDIKCFVGNFYRMRAQDKLQLSYKSYINKVLKNSFYYEATRDFTETSGTLMITKDLLLKEPFNEQYWRYEDADRSYRLMRKEKIYMFSEPVSVINLTSACASRPRKNVNDDFLGHLSFENVSFWEQMCLYLLANVCKMEYPDEAIHLYSNIYKRKDLKYTFFFIRVRNFIIRRWRDLKYKEETIRLGDLLRL